MEIETIHFIFGHIKNKNSRTYIVICNYMLLIDGEMQILTDAYGEYDLIYPKGKVLKCYRNWNEIPCCEFPWSLFR